MVDSTKAMEGLYLNAASVERSPSKKIIILEEGEYQEVDYGKGTEERLTLKVEMDKHPKLWRPNKDSVKNIVRVTDSVNTKGWVGVVCDLGIITIQGKESVIVKEVHKYVQHTEEVE